MMTDMCMLRAAAGVLTATCLLLAAPAATGKEFVGPGDLLLCGRTHCVDLESIRAARAFSAFLYGGTSVRRSQPPDRAARALELEFNGPGSGPVALVAGRWLDRIRVYGLNCGRFRRGVWYRLPPVIARELRRVGTTLAPLRIPPAPRSC